MGCANQPRATSAAGGSWVYRGVHAVRTTAYTHGEKGGGRNAIGTPLHGSKGMSAAADWSYSPLGTKFRIVAPDEVFRGDDYGFAPAGPRPNRLYKTNRLGVEHWGGRSVDIHNLGWGL